jgi:transposase
VLFEDECHLLWGDLCGYVWGKTNERIEVPIVNERSKLTYYGAVNLLTQQCLVQAYESGNSESTIAFLKYLLSQCPNSRIAVLWDGASYHCSIEVRAYLASVNQGFEESERKLTCIRCSSQRTRAKPD